MSQFLEQPVTLRPRPIRVVDERYYQRMQAIEFTLKHDDGQNPQDLPKADIIILGLSRTGKRLYPFILVTMDFTSPTFPSYTPYRYPCN